MRFFMFMASLSLLLTSCSQSPAKKASSDQTPPVLGTHYTTIEFEEGNTQLTKESKKQIADLIAKAYESDYDIEDIRILAWADKEYPEGKEKATTEDIQLASERAREIREYLEEELQETEDIDSFNMARRPDFLSKFFKNDEFKVKKSYEQSGPTASKLPDGSVSYTKASKALVIIDYKKDEEN